MALLTDLLPRLTIAGGDDPIQIDGLFSHLLHELWLEIGFGGGENLVEEARHRPNCGFIGCEPFVNGVAKILALIAANDVANIRLHVGDAAELIERMPAACLARVHLFYPDPWPKRRHHRRRFLSDAALNALARVMQRGAELRLATDVDDYTGWALARVIRSQHFVWPAESARDWLRPWPDWPSTRYERKALQAGRPLAYLTFIRG
jgi:tRNA (guanine-N7-)-methyltransferase